MGPQRSRPVVPQVEPERDPATARRGADTGQSGVLELQHPGLVDLEHRTGGGQLEPEGAGVQPRPQQHGLHCPGADRGQQRVVVEAAAQADVSRAVQVQCLRVGHR
jgi:hypothetical protein